MKNQYPREVNLVFNEEECRKRALVHLHNARKARMDANRAKYIYHTRMAKVWDTRANEGGFCRV